MDIRPLAPQAPKVVGMKPMKQTLSLKYLEGQIDILKEENTGLKKEIGSLKDEVVSLKQELQGLQIVVSENIERREAVETGLVSVEQACSDLQDQQSKIVSAVEVQAQYSRKTTLLLTGRVIPPYREGEHTRAGVVSLLKEYLGIDVHMRAITACHRLRNKSIILVRFADLDERMAVYRQRYTPVKKGLMIHESLTNERLSVIKTLQKLSKPKETAPFKSYFTSMGRIFIRVSAGTDPVELFVGTTEQNVLDICQAHKAENRTGTARPPKPDQTRAANQSSSDRSAAGQTWQKAGSKKGKNQTTAGPSRPDLTTGTSVGSAASTSEAVGAVGEAPAPDHASTQHITDSSSTMKGPASESDEAQTSMTANSQLTLAEGEPHTTPEPEPVVEKPPSPSGTELNDPNQEIGNNSPASETSKSQSDTNTSTDSTETDPNGA